MLMMMMIVIMMMIMMMMIMIMMMMIMIIMIMIMIADHGIAVLAVSILLSFIFQAYVNSKLASNTSYTLTLSNLGTSDTTASINGNPASLVTLTGGSNGIHLGFFNGTLIVGGYQYKSEVKVSIYFF